MYSVYRAKKTLNATHRREMFSALDSRYLKELQTS
jgi:hypothetical protein